MHCTKCGQPIHPGEAFCSECGAPVRKAVPEVAPVLEFGGFSANPVVPAEPAPKRRRSYTISVFVAMISLIMLVSMMIMPMVKLYEDRDDDNYEVLGLTSGSYYGSSEEETRQIAYTSVACFVLLNASIIAIPVFSFINKGIISASLSLCNGALLTWYFVTVSSAYDKLAPRGSDYRCEMDIGLLFCFLCAAVTAVLTIVEYSTEKNQS